MTTTRGLSLSVVSSLLLGLSACTVSNVSFTGIDRPDRAAELEAYDVFVGRWTWDAHMVNADEGDASWTGSAEWKWTLDNRCLFGHLSAKSRNASFEAEGIWSWHPKKRKYIWSMQNNWGYPQRGSARYNEDDRSWRMSYRSVGLDGTTSYGRYEMTVADNNTLDWCVQEWADPFHLIKKMEMTGTYKRQR